MIRVSSNYRAKKYKVLDFGKAYCRVCRRKFDKVATIQYYCSEKCSIKRASKINKAKRLKDLQSGDPKVIKSAALRLRFEILKRDNFACQYCGRKAPEVILNIDHRIARIKGGSNNIDNLITACWECNIGKGDVLLNERKI